MVVGSGGGGGGGGGGWEEGEVRGVFFLSVGEWGGLSGCLESKLQGTTSVKNCP